MENNPKYEQFILETKIKRYEKKIKELESKAKQETPKQDSLFPEWSENVWEQCAHELVWAIGMLEDAPTSPKVWRKVFNVLRSYENLVRTGGKK